MSVLVNALIIFIINYLFCLLCNLKLNLTEICFKIMNIFQNALTGQKKAHLTVCQRRHFRSQRGSIWDTKTL